MEAVYAKAAWRIIPFCMLLYVFSFLDRVNVGFAAATMNADLGFSPQVYGFGAGIFFIGYFLCEMPSNLILARVGARLWIARIMATWGIISMAMAFVGGPWGFFILRFLLGVAEAGFFPGIILYLTFWFPRALLARFIALFLAGVPLASVIGAPLSSWILGFDGLWGLRGWQLLFLLEGAPCLLLAVLTLLVLPDGPLRATWLDDKERALIASRLAAEPRASLHGVAEMLLDKRVWLIALPDFGIVLALYGLGLWLPLIVGDMGFGRMATGFIVSVPYAAAVVAMVLLGLSSDRRQERAGHVAFACVLAALGLAGGALFAAHGAQLIALTVAAAGIYGALAVFWTLPPSFLGGAAAAAGIGLVNSLGNLGGFAGPYLMGWLRGQTGDYRIGMWVLAAGLMAAAVLVMVLAPRLRTDR